VKEISKLQEILFTPWVLAGALLAGLGVLVLLQRSPDTQSNFNPSETYPQVFMTQVETREFDETGKLQHTINTPRITQYQIDPDTPSDQDFTLILEPKIELYQDSRPTPWKVSAHQGRSLANSKSLQLTDQVLIEQESSEQGPIAIRTSELWIYPSKQFAETDKAVNMRGTAIQVDAVGMRAHLLEERIELNSQVRSTYEPKR